MFKLRIVVGMLILCLSLSACRSPWPQPKAATVSADAAQCALRPDAAWRTWQADSQPDAVQALLAEPDAVWAGTSQGVFRVDRRTGVAAQSLDYATSNGISNLFPLGEGRVWADTGRGPFYFDGQTWAPLHITGTAGAFTVFTIDLNGDVLLYAAAYRSYAFYRLPGHVPPRTGFWAATREPYSSWGDPTNCQFQTFISNHFSYRTQAECQALHQARQKVREKTGQDVYAALDADGSIWWVRPGMSGYPLLGHLSENSSVLLPLPSMSISRLEPDPVRGVWIGTESGLLYSDGQDVRSVPLKFGGVRAARLSEWPGG